MIARRVNGANGTTVVLEHPGSLPLVEHETWDIRLYRWYGNTLGVLVVLYLLLDRGIAHFHLPKTPAFIGELTLALGVLAIMAGTQWLRRALAGDVLLGTLIAYMIWCLFRTVPNMHIFGIQVTIRDAALWYYAGFAIALVAACTAVPDLLEKMVRGFRIVLPLVTVWLPIALLLERSGVLGPRFRYSSVPLLSHKPGNICCAAVICLAFLLLMPRNRTNGDGNGDSGRPPRFRLLRQRRYRPGVWVSLIVINIFTMLLGATQTRGGGLAELAAVFVMFCFMERTRRSRTLAAFIAGLLLVIGLGLATGASYHTQKRTISVSQLFENASSVSGGTNSQLGGSVSFRFDLWGTILSKQEKTSHLVNGFGFGVNLARTGGLNPRPNQPATLQLRSAHNSWLDVFARTGIIGALLFLIVWIGWFRRMGRARRRARDEELRGVIGVCICGSIAILINSFFDPTLEGAQVAAVLFTLFGLGIVATRRSEDAGPEPPEPSDERAALPAPRGPRSPASRVATHLTDQTSFGADAGAARRWRVLQVHTPHREFGGEDVAVEADRRLLEEGGHTVGQFLVENPRGVGSATGAILRAPWNSSSARQALDHARSFRPDIVHVHNTWFALSPAVISTLSTASYPVLVTLHNFRTVCANGLLQRGGRPCSLCVGSHAGHAVIHRCYRGSAVLSASAALTIELARRRGVWGGKVDEFFVLEESAVPPLVAGGIPEDRITIRPNFVSDAEPRAATPSTSSDVVFVGRLSPEKGPDLLLDAWRRATPAGLRLRVYGDGPLRPLLETTGAPQVSFMGRVPPAEIRRALGTARALVFPSTCREAGPLAPLEAAAAGLPIVMSDSVGMSGRVAGAGAGWSFPSGDPGALAARLAQLRDNAAVDRAGAAALAMHERYYSPNRALHELESAYRRAYVRQVTRR